VKDELQIQTFKPMIAKLDNAVALSPGSHVYQYEVIADD